MLITRRLRLTSPLLASQRSNDPKSPRRSFRRWNGIPKGEDSNKVFIRTDLKRWVWALLEARDEKGLDDVALTITPNRWYTAKKTSTYHRNFRRGQQACNEPFEAISSGQVIEMRFVLSRHLAPDITGNGRFTRPPDEEEFDVMLTYIGEYVGMSEWGNEYGYGRFELQPREFYNAAPAATSTSGGDECPADRGDFLSEQEEQEG